MFTRSVYFLVFILTVHITVIRCEPDENLAENFQNKDQEIWNDALAESPSQFDSPLDVIISNIENQMEEEFRDIEEKIAMNLGQGIENFSSLALFTKIPINPQIGDDDHSKSEKIDDGGNEQRNNVLDDSNLMMRLLESFDKAEQEELRQEKLNNSFDIPIYVGNKYENIEQLIQPNDLLMANGLGNEHDMNETFDEDPKIKAEFYFFELRDVDEDKNPIEKRTQNGLPSANITTSRNSENELSSFIYQIMGNFTDGIQNMMNVLRQTLSNLSLDDKLFGNEYDIPDVFSKFKISIQNEGVSHFIPSNAYVNRTNSGSVNITWISGMRDFNNSLFLKLSNDESGNTIFQHVHLRTLQDYEIHEYKLDKPVIFNPSNGISNETTINLTEKVKISFFNSDFQDVLTVDMRENYINTNNWLAVAIAVLGLIVAGLIMLISYIIHKRNQSYARKESLSKEPMVY